MSYHNQNTRPHKVQLQSTITIPYFNVYATQILLQERKYFLSQTIQTKCKYFVITLRMPSGLLQLIWRELLSDFSSFVLKWNQQAKVGNSFGYFVSYIVLSSHPQASKTLKAWSLNYYYFFFFAASNYYFLVVAVNILNNEISSDTSGLQYQQETLTYLLWGLKIFLFFKVGNYIFFNDTTLFLWYVLRKVY